jgi:hypothetical protein
MLHSDIDPFLKYDYIVAPWPHTALAFDKRIGFKRHPVGNGGFSLRNGTMMLQLTQQFSPGSMTENEDVFFSRHCYFTLNCRMPSAQVAYAFTRENFCRKIPGSRANLAIPLALHQFWRAKSNTAEDFYRLVRKETETSSAQNNVIFLAH